MIGFLSGNVDLAAANEVLRALKEFCDLANAFPANTSGIYQGWHYDPTADSGEAPGHRESDKFRNAARARDWLNTTLNRLSALGPKLKNNPLVRAAAGSGGSAAMTGGVDLQSWFENGGYANARKMFDSYDQGGAYLKAAELAQLLQALCVNAQARVNAGIAHATATAVSSGYQSAKSKAAATVQAIKESGAVSDALSSASSAMNRLVKEAKSQGIKIGARLLVGSAIAKFVGNRPHVVAAPKKMQTYNCPDGSIVSFFDAIDPMTLCTPKNWDASQLPGGSNAYGIPLPPSQPASVPYDPNNYYQQIGPVHQGGTDYGATPTAPQQVQPSQTPAAQPVYVAPGTPLVKVPTGSRPVTSAPPTDAPISTGPKLIVPNAPGWAKLHKQDGSTVWFNPATGEEAQVVIGGGSGMYGLAAVRKPRVHKCWDGSYAQVGAKCPPRPKKQRPARGGFPGVHIMTSTEIAAAASAAQPAVKSVTCANGQVLTYDPSVYTAEQMLAKCGPVQAAPVISDAQISFTPPAQQQGGMIDYGARPTAPQQPVYVPPPGLTFRPAAPADGMTTVPVNQGPAQGGNIYPYVTQDPGGTFLYNPDPTIIFGTEMRTPPIKINPQNPGGGGGKKPANAANAGGNLPPLGPGGNFSAPFPVNYGSQISMTGDPTLDRTQDIPPALPMDAIIASKSGGAMTGLGAAPSIEASNKLLLLGLAVGALYWAFRK